DGSGGKWWRKLDGNFVAGLELDSGKDQDAAFAHVIAAAAHDPGVSVMRVDEPDGYVKPVPLPTPEDCFFLGSSRARMGCRTYARLGCHGTDHPRAPSHNEGYRSTKGLANHS